MGRCMIQSVVSYIVVNERRLLFVHAESELTGIGGAKISTHIFQTIGFVSFRFKYKGILLVRRKRIISRRLPILRVT